jgi:hypothetical protein
VDQSMEMPSSSSRDVSSLNRSRTSCEGRSFKRRFQFTLYETLFHSQIHQRVRHLPHMPFTRYNLAKRHPSLLPAMRIVRFTMFGSKYQVWFPGRHQQTCSNASKNGLKRQQHQQFLSKQANTSVSLWVLKLTFLSASSSYYSTLSCSKFRKKNHFLQVQ